MKHLRAISAVHPAPGSVGIGLFEKIQVFLTNIVEFLQNLFGGGDNAG